MQQCCKYKTNSFLQRSAEKKNSFWGRKVKRLAQKKALKQKQGRERNAPSLLSLSAIASNRAQPVVAYPALNISFNIRPAVFPFFDLYFGSFGQWVRHQGR